MLTQPHRAWGGGGQYVPNKGSDYRCQKSFESVCLRMPCCVLGSKNTVPASSRTFNFVLASKGAVEQYASILLKGKGGL